MKFAFLVLIGVPATGKTTFAKSLAENSLKLKYTFVHVCYDDILQAKKISICPPKQWKKDRECLADNLELLLKSVLEGASNTCPDMFLTIHDQIKESSKPVVIIIDDNMYYRSMRYRYYQIAKRNSFSFCQLFFKSTLLNAKCINSKRAELDKIPDCVIENIYYRLEPPSKEYGWENYYLVIEPYQDFSVISQDFFHLLELAFLNPETQLVIENKNSEDPLNIIHLVDIATRKVISKKIKEASLRLPKTEMKEFSENLIIKKKTVLADLRDGTAVLPQNVLHDLTLSNVQIYVETLL